MERRITPELLDHLAADHADAIASRRDLDVINRLMGNYRWFENEVRRHAPTGARFTEIGAGSGQLAKRLLKTGRIGSYCAIDRMPCPPDWPAEWTWRQCDIAEAGDFEGSDVLLANLVLHHFDNALLRGIGEKLDRSAVKLLLLNEPARRKRHLWQLKLTPLLRFNAVTHHDSRASVRAGFSGTELPELMGLDPARWRIMISTAFLGAYRVCALRR